MSEQDRKDFDDRLAELNNWQIEHQKKLKIFQEAQRKLLDLEHQNLLNGLNTYNFNRRHNKCNDNNDSEKLETENNFISQNFKDRNGIFNLKFPQISLSEPKSSIFSVQNVSPVADKSDNFFSESLEEREINKPKKFLKRGEGLARFRMTLNDFKGPPKIYREKKIKTYLSSRPESKASSRSSKSTKTSLKPNKNIAAKVSAKSAPLPVKIYIPESKKTNSVWSAVNKPDIQNVRKLNQCPKTPIENLTLKPHVIATEWYNAMKAKEKSDNKIENFTDKTNSICESDIERKKDEKELRIFEILEKKVDDVSFCSTSSFVDKLMEQSLSSTPSKQCSESKEINLPYAQGLKSLRSKFLDEEQIKKFDDFNETSDRDNLSDESESKNTTPDNRSLKEVVVEKIDEAETCENHNPLQSPEDEIDKTEKLEEIQSHKVNKTLLQEYIKNFKKFKFILAENSHKIKEKKEQEEVEEIPPKELLKEDKQQPNQHEIALKLQRKGLQDNVKQLLNWENPPRKRQPKRLVKKIKSRPKLEKSKTVTKEQSEKIVFNSSLLYERLNELEKEIEIFRRENKNLEKLEKECNEERIRLGKERRELQRQFQEERERLEGRIAEEQKKLQKERAVFEKYCKQVKNQPTRQEREETAKLKKEVEKLTETLTTKEARWGASQARLRNQIKNLQKENNQLKAEVEKYKKLSAKKVSFEQERNLNTKIIHAINSELGKIKPTVIRNSNVEKNQVLSDRIERNLVEKPIRRIRSAPNVKKQMESDLYVEAYSEQDEKALGSVSTDSGIEANGSRYMPPHTMAHEPKVTKERICDEVERRNCGSPLFGSFKEDTKGRKCESPTEAIVRDAIFGDVSMDATSLKIAEVKNRLGRLSLLGCGGDNTEKRPVKMVKIPSDHRESEGEGEEEDESTGEEEDEDDEEGDEEKETEDERKIQNGGRGLGKDCPLRKSILNKSDSLSNSFPRRGLIESKPGENGIWEKYFEDGSKEINYPNGNVKKIFPGSKIVRMTYYNGDIKETDVVEGSEKYYYAETKTWHTSYKDGLEVLEFPNGQTERRHADGSTEISFPNGCIRYCDSSGRDEWRFLDGTVIKTNQLGHKILLMPNGQKEIHTEEFKRREYPDGTVKILYSDGTQETRYSSGRVRLKDKDGNLVMDSGGIR